MAFRFPSLRKARLQDEVRRFRLGVPRLEPMLPNPPQALMELAEIAWHGWFWPQDVINGDVSEAWDSGVYMWLDTAMNPLVTPLRGTHKKILYIGKCFFQSFTQRISQEWNEPIGRWLRRNSKYDLTLKLGTVALVGRERLSQAMLEDVENLLIIAQRPSGNISSTETYAGRDLTIINGCRHAPLPISVSTDELE